MKTYYYLASATALALGTSPVAAQEMDHGQMDHGQMDHAQMDNEETTDHDWRTADPVSTPMPSEGSGTSRLPGYQYSHNGLHIASGDDWMLMLHGYAWGVYTDQSGQRGESKAYVQSMAMLTAEKQTGWGRVQLKSMSSLEPIMSNRGYPNLFATGETANGDPLTDRQHPHDFFMELAGRVDVNIDESRRVFLYGGPVGEPALGPSAFMHRGAARYNPEAPISHHWFDSTHITYGVVTAGFASNHLQLEGSLFTGREPDESRWGIDKMRFDSWSVRATWSPSPSWSIQASTGRLNEPEPLHIGQDEQRTTASAHYANGKGLSAMFAFSAKDRKPGRTLTAWLAEANWDMDNHSTLFGRIENVRNDELFPDHADPLHDQPFRVTKFQAGYAYRLPLGDDFNLALGGTVSAFAKPDALDVAYGGNPVGATVFARLSLGY